MILVLEIEYEIAISTWPCRIRVRIGHTGASRTQYASYNTDNINYILSTIRMSEICFHVINEVCIYYSVQRNTRR